MSLSFARDRVLEALAAAGQLVEVRGDLPATFAGISDDSRQVQPGTMFVAVRGTVTDGHRYIAPAVAAGATAVVAEEAPNATVPAIVVRDSRRAAGLVAAAAFGHPVRGLTLVAVTGTNGKTTTVGLLRHLLDANGPAASIGTLGVLVKSEGKPFPGGSGLTTPGPIELQRVLRGLADAGVRQVAMEVSSHSLEQRRVEGVQFAAAVFTNVTRDHLDYHGTLDAYIAAKARLVEYLAAGGTVVVNADDPAWDRLPPAPRRLTFGRRSQAANVTATEVRMTDGGSEWTLVADGATAPVRLPLAGDFNVTNALGAAAAGVALGYELPAIAARLSAAPQVPGRLERLLARPLVLRDYAHTPDALARALEAVRPPRPGRLVVVFGCGGDRDRGKRPEMGAIAERLADVVVLTSDNPRTEDPERILDDIEAGMRGRAHERIEDRRRAIERALELAGADDVVLLAGKGHETYQIRGTTSLPFDEREIVQELASRLARGART